MVSHSRFMHFPAGNGFSRGRVAMPVVNRGSKVKGQSRCMKFARWYFCPSSLFNNFRDLMESEGKISLTTQLHSGAAATTGPSSGTATTVSSTDPVVTLVHFCRSTFPNSSRRQLPRNFFPPHTRAREHVSRTPRRRVSHTPVNSEKTG